MVLGSFCYICHSAALCNGARGEICCAWSATCCFCYQYTPTPVAKTVRKEADIQWRHKSTGGHMLGLESIRPNNKGIGGDTKSPSSRNRSPNCIRKTKNTFCGTPVSVCPSSQILWKTASPRKISLKSDNRLLINGRKQFWIWRPSAILNFRGLEWGLWKLIVVVPIARQ